MHTLRAFVVVLVASAGAALATGEKPGRYTMSPVEGGGFARLDTETGQMSICQRRDADWSCREMSDPSRGLSLEIERLRTENQRLKGEIRQMEEIMLGQKRDGGASPGRPTAEFRLPSEQEVDAAMDYAQRMLRKFRDKLRELEGEAKGLKL